MINRYLQLAELIKNKTTFLLGPRSTGKSFWIKEQLKDCLYIDLLRSADRRRYTANPSLLEEVASAHKNSIIVIDEIQLVPELLDEVHHIIENSNTRFLLTGSSARKLKRADANMLGGRARRAGFHPLTWKELSDDGSFNLQKYLLYGGIPRIYLSERPEDELSDYVDTYLNEEIKAEAISRNIIGFEKFFHGAALSNGEVLNYSKIAADSQLTPATVRNYYEVLEDTLVGFYLTPWQGPKRKAIQSAKFYLFDQGVCRFMAQITSLPEQSDLFGKAFEQFIVQEIFALISYKRLRKKLYFWRTTHQDEVDLIIENEFAIEIKSGKKIENKHLGGLRKIMDEGYTGRKVIVSRDTIRREKNGIEIWYWEDFLKELWEKL